VKNITIIFNPTAGEGLAEKRWAVFQKDLSVQNIDVNLRTTEYKGHAIELAQEIAEDGVKRIGVFGGDGTLNEVVHGLMKAEAQDIELVLFPAGSSCDFEKKLSFTEKWTDRITSQETTMVDVCRVDCQDEEGNSVSRHFINNSSIGIISLSNEKFNSVSGWSKRFKQWTVDGAAVMAGLAAIKEFYGFEGQLALAGKDLGNESYSNITFFKNPYFAGGMNYGVETDPSDGQMSVVTVGFKSRMNLAGLIPSLYIGNITKRKGASFHTCQSATIEADQLMLIETDGEVAGYTPASYSIIKNGIKLVV